VTAGLLLMLMAAAILIPLLATWAAFRSQTSTDERDSVARILGGRPGAASARGASEVALTVAGRPARLAWVRRSGGTDSWTELEVSLSPPPLGTLLIGWYRQAEELAAVHGPQDLEVGEGFFDRRYVVKTRSEDLLRRLFSAERRAPTVASIRSLEAHGVPRLQLGRETLTVRVAGRAPVAAVARSLLATAVYWLETLREVGQVAAIEWVGDGATAGARCQVCGTDLAERVVACASCRTPHHRECWEYAGQCSTFACAEDRYVSNGVTVIRRQTPEEGPREEVERDRRPTGESLARVEEILARRARNLREGRRG
jgi:hypothetical protein